MTHWSKPIGDDRINRSRRLATLEREQARTLVRIAHETDDVPVRQAKGATPAGDEWRLRGVPVQARGVGGAIRGTRP